MNHEEITKAIKTLRDMCNDYADCKYCPCGEIDGDCCINYLKPKEWQLLDKPVVKLMEA